MNFKHLHYFWVAAKAGGVVRAGEQLHTTPQTLSAQIKLLEGRLGRQLFRKSGRQLELTDDGRVALRYADEIFNLGADLETAMREQRRQGQQVLEFRVGVEDAVAKTVAYGAGTGAEPARAGAADLHRRPLQRPDGATGAASHGPGHRRRAADQPAQRQGLQPRAGLVADELLLRPRRCAARCVDRFHSA